MAKYKLVFEVQDMSLPEGRDHLDNLIHEKSQVVIEFDEKTVLVDLPARERSKLPELTDAHIEPLQRAFIQEGMQAAGESMARSAAARILEHIKGKVSA